MKRNGMIVVVAMALLPSLASATNISSCTDLHNYIQRGVPGDLWTQIQDLKSAKGFMTQNPGACATYDVERARWTYADALHKFSETFAGNSAATTNWALKAGTEYENYLEWFLSLSPSEQDNLIAAVTGRPAALPEFDGTRRRWLRQRVGNVLNSLGSVYELAKAYSKLLDSYSTLSSDCLDAGSSCVRVFPTEVVEKWFKWLRTLPDFKIARSDSQIGTLVQEDGECLQAWRTFKLFLDTYVPANPSTRVQWQPRLKRIALWIGEEP